MKRKQQQAAVHKEKVKLGVNLLELGIEFGIIIAAPLILLIALGFYLDKTLGTVPIFILLGLFSSLSISFYALYKKINPILQDLNKKK